VNKSVILVEGGAGIYLLNALACVRVRKKLGIYIGMVYER